MAKKFSAEELIKAFKCSRNNKKQLLEGEICGCFSCCTIFRPYEINEWFHEEIDDTAICPYCYTDAIIGEVSGHPITKEFLTVMNEYWYPGFPIWSEYWWLYIR